jgi:hypothetical protein
LTICSQYIKTKYSDKYFNMMLKITNIILGFVVVLVLLELVSMSCYFKIGFIGWRSKKKEEEEEAKEK